MSKPAESPKLSAALTVEKDARGLKVETIRKAFCVSETTARAILTGEWDERFADIRHALGYLPAAARDAVIGVLVPPPGEAPDADFNGDGRRDERDLTAGSARLTERIGRWQQKADGQDPFTELEAAELRSDLDEFARIVDGLRALVGELTEKPGPRAAAG